MVLPNGLGKTVRVLVFAKGEKFKEALDAGADFAGADEFVEKIREGWLEFDKTVATPDMMGSVGKVSGAGFQEDRRSYMDRAKKKRG